jgi:hypothetical protein
LKHRFSLAPKIQVCHAGKTLKPYQGLKPAAIMLIKAGTLSAGKTLKPYQGLKPADCRVAPLIALYNAGKTLNPDLRLETLYWKAFASDNVAGKTLNPYQGLKQSTSTLQKT